MHPEVVRFSPSVCGNRNAFPIGFAAPGQRHAGYSAWSAPSKMNLAPCALFGTQLPQVAQHATITSSRLRPFSQSLVAQAAVTQQRGCTTANFEAGITQLLPPVVNWHLETRCNYGCKFCFATFLDIPPAEIPKALSELRGVPALLKQWGAHRINFAGGEPFLHPLIDELIGAAKKAGLSTSAVTNGSRLTAERLYHLSEHLDSITFSVDASTDELHAAMGRGERFEVTKEEPSSGHLARIIPLWESARRMGYHMKLNTVVSQVNLHDDMSDLVKALRPDRWKVFQMLPIKGQNDEHLHNMQITEKQFESWVARHGAALEGAGVPLVAEPNSLMQGSYAMLDAKCRFFGNSTGEHLYGPSLLEEGVPGAWLAVSGGFDAKKFGDRGGIYDWGQGGQKRQQEEDWVKNNSG